ncbi:MAG: hypothetical protein ACLR0U_17510 [Enterocloster clostridioformis]
MQSLILACTLIVIGFLTLMMGLLGDILASNKEVAGRRNIMLGGLNMISYKIKRNKGIW